MLNTPQNPQITLDRFDYEQLIENLQMLAQNFSDLASLLYLCQDTTTPHCTKLSLARLGSYNASEYGEMTHAIAQDAKARLGGDQ